MTFYLYLAATIVMSALGQIFFKNYFVSKKKVNIILALTLFISTPYLAYEALKGLSMDIMAITSSIIIVIVHLGSVVIIKETQSRYELMGIGLILGGLFIYYF